MLYYGILKNGEITIANKVNQGDFVIFNTDNRDDANMMALEVNIYSKLTRQFIMNSNEKLITKI